MARRGSVTALVMVWALMLLSPNSAAARGTSGLNIVNNSGEALTGLSIRRTGTASWQPLPSTPAEPARGTKATSPFADPDCAFDIKATLEDGKDAVWLGLNLCEVKLLTLNRNASGETWADYD